MHRTYCFVGVDDDDEGERVRVGDDGRSVGLICNNGRSTTSDFFHCLSFHSSVSLPLWCGVLVAPKFGTGGLTILVD